MTKKKGSSDRNVQHGAKGRYRLQRMKLREENRQISSGFNATGKLSRHRLGSFSLRHRTCFGIFVLILSKNKNIGRRSVGTEELLFIGRVHDGGRTVFHGVQRSSFFTAQRLGRDFETSSDDGRDVFAIKWHSSPDLIRDLLRRKMVGGSRCGGFLCKTKTGPLRGGAPRPFTEPCVRVAHTGSWIKNRIFRQG